MQVKVLQVGPIGTNCYLLEDEKAHVAAVIDPGDEAGRILQVIKDDGVDVKYILLTHGHYDHTTAVPELHQALPQAEIYIHKADANGAGDPVTDVLRLHLQVLLVIKANLCQGDLPLLTKKYTIIKYSTPPWEQRQEVFRRSGAKVRRDFRENFDDFSVFLFTAGNAFRYTIPSVL